MSKSNSNQQEPNFEGMTHDEKLQWARQQCDALRVSLAKQREDLLRCTNRDFNTGFRFGQEDRIKWHDGVDKIYDKI